jgi:hypothetical protein
MTCGRSKTKATYIWQIAGGGGDEGPRRRGKDNTERRAKPTAQGRGSSP